MASIAWRGMLVAACSGSSPPYLEKEWVDSLETKKMYLALFHPGVTSF